MKLFARKSQNFEPLPDQITGNDLIECWHSNADGSLGYLVVDGSAKSAESVERFWRRVLFTIVGAFIAWKLLAKIILACFASVTPAGAGWLGFWAVFLLAGLAIYYLHDGMAERRVCTVTTDELTIERTEGTFTYPMTQVVGVQRQPVDQQKIDKERRRYRKQRNPQLKQPFSAELMLETTLGQVSLGAVFGLEEARNIADALNTTIQFMKGRSATGAGTVVDPQFQYKGKSAGQIPD
ncbi:hypothetical protein TH25_21175 [Thalassospira profundimaris]|uniref:Uncharacterized protein n=1 Tax=Thalassospira profundimaris TaxID=502049 RepID=A0A367WQD1_9PROT|nr:hypothetical protein [Thalassospira profundimaris]RCK43664.1 hypothetical protein TH25_21175 [Thalassospira profundimaris]